MKPIFVIYLFILIAIAGCNDETTSPVLNNTADIVNSKKYSHLIVELKNIKIEYDISQSGYNPGTGSYNSSGKGSILQTISIKQNPSAEIITYTYNSVKFYLDYFIASRYGSNSESRIAFFKFNFERMIIDTFYVIDGSGYNYQVSLGSERSGFSNRKNMMFVGLPLLVTSDSTISLSLKGNDIKKYYISSSYIESNYTHPGYGSSRGKYSSDYSRTPTGNYEISDSTHFNLILR